MPTVEATIKPDTLFQKIRWTKQALIDMDGCVCEYDFPKIVKTFFGIDLSSQAIFAYDLADVLGVAPHLINQMFKQQVWGTPRFMPDAIETLTDWDKKG